ncbi:MAG: HNH endonuclease [Blastocatellia bacterium]
MKKCLNCGNPVPEYRVKHCSVYCRKGIRKWAELSYRKHRKSSCERCRESPSGLHVHHLNGNPADNRPDNLIRLLPVTERKVALLDLILNLANEGDRNLVIRKPPGNIRCDYRGQA